MSEHEQMVEECMRAVETARRYWREEAYAAAAKGQHRAARALFSIASNHEAAHAQRLGRGPEAASSWLLAGMLALKAELPTKALDCARSGARAASGGDVTELMRLNDEAVAAFHAQVAANAVRG